MEAFGAPGMFFGGIIMGFVFGTAASEELQGTDENDVILGAGGNDSIFTGLGDDLASGDEGDDMLVSPSGQDTLIGGAGNDMLGGYWDSAADMFGNEGNDSLYSGGAGGALDGGADDDVLHFFSERGASFEATGGSGADRFVLEHFPEYENTEYTVRITDFELGVDLIEGPTLPVTPELQLVAVEGEAGLPGPLPPLGTLSLSQGEEGAIVANGTGGEAVLLGVDALDLLRDGSMRFVNVTYLDDAGARVIAGDADDMIVGGAGDDLIGGGSGDDLLLGGEGNDSLNGNRGNDTIDGGAGNDTIHGNQGSNLLIGGVGDDYITTGNQATEVDAGEGDDHILIGMKSGGDHVLTGGDGADHFDFRYLTSRKQGDVVITDLELGIDSVTIEGLDLGAYMLGHAGVTLTDVEGGALLSLDTNDTILFEGLTASEIAAWYIEPVLPPLDLMLS